MMCREMAAAEVHIEHDPEQARIESWRFEALIRAGFEPETAAELAARTDVDLHSALDLAGRGCPPELAARILL